MVPHFGSRVQFKMLQSELFVDSQTEIVLVTEVGIFELFPGDILSMDLKTSGLPIRVTFLNAVPDLLEIVLQKEKNLIIMRNWNKCLYFIKHYLFMMADDQFKIICLSVEGIQHFLILLYSLLNFYFCVTYEN